jgi:hypothetical protein
MNSYFDFTALSRDCQCNNNVIYIELSFKISDGICTRVGIMKHVRLQIYLRIGYSPLKIRIIINDLREIAYIHKRSFKIRLVSRDE